MDMRTHARDSGSARPTSASDGRSSDVRCGQPRTPLASCPSSRSSTRSSSFTSLPFSSPTGTGSLRSSGDAAALEREQRVELRVGRPDLIGDNPASYGQQFDACAHSPTATRTRDGLWSHPARGRGAVRRGGARRRARARRLSADRGAGARGGQRASRRVSCSPP